ncbi:MAG: patatin-like phospholipase family protein [Thermoguttaceae bacterium]
MIGKDAARWIALATVLLSGCAATRSYPAPPLQPSASLIEADVAAASQSRPWPTSGGTATRVPRNVLVLSGGGMCGAYTVGVLSGWSAAGTRPCFDIVTGVSTGALIAPFAFLGQEYDAELERIYTSTRQGNVVCPRLLWLDSLASSEPLEKQIATSATPEVLRQIAAAHREGRRLYVGTTNLDTKSLVVWDLGAIAARNTQESQDLFRKVLLASCSIPGLLPPVPIDIEVDGKRFTELHVDGGVTACVFLQPAMLGIGPRGELPSTGDRSTIHVVVAGKLEQTYVPARRQLLSIASESASTVLQAKLEGELGQLFSLARYVNADFRLAGIPQDYTIAGTNMSFDPRVMRGLFDEGWRGGKSGTVWQSIPPRLAREIAAKPRRDTRFVAVHDEPSQSPGHAERF